MVDSLEALANTKHRPLNMELVFLGNWVLNYTLGSLVERMLLAIALDQGQSTTRDEHAVYLGKQLIQGLFWDVIAYRDGPTAGVVNEICIMFPDKLGVRETVRLHVCRPKGHCQNADYWLVDLKFRLFKSLTVPGVLIFFVLSPGWNYHVITWDGGRCGFHECDC